MARPADAPSLVELRNLERDLTQVLDGQLRIGQGRIGMPMPEKVTCDVEGKPSLNEMCRERMAQDMRATPYRAHLRLVERASNDVVHRGTLPKRQVCPVVPDEHLAGVGGWPPAAEIRCEGVADGRRQGQHQR